MSRLPLVWQFGAVCIFTGLVADVFSLWWWLKCRRLRAEREQLRTALAIASDRLAEVDELADAIAAAKHFMPERERLAELAPPISPASPIRVLGAGELQARCHCCLRLESELVKLKPSGLCLDWRGCIIAAGRRGRLADA